MNTALRACPRNAECWLSEGHDEFCQRPDGTIIIRRIIDWPKATDDQAVEELGIAMADLDNWPEGARAMLWGFDMRPLARALLEKVRAR